MKFILPLLLVAVYPHPVHAQAAPRAIVVDGAGPWRDSRWALAVTEFNSLLRDAGYSVATVSPVDLPSAIPAHGTLLATPSLESLPFDTFNAVVAHLEAGGSLLATGGEPFRDPLYLTPASHWLTSPAYIQEVGAPPPQGPFVPPSIETLSPARKQYTNSLGLRVPIARGRGLSATPGSDGRYSVIGDLLAPAATLHIGNDYGFSSRTGSMVIWLPWPQLFNPLRAQLVTALQAAAKHLYLLSAGPEHLVWLPGENVAGRANIINGGDVPVEAVLQWSIAGSAQPVPQPSVPLSLAVGELRTVPLSFGRLPSGDYTATLRLMLGDREADRIESPIRVFDPTLTRQSDRKIRVVDGAFSAGGRHVFLNGVNYWPRYIAGIEQVLFNGRSWLSPEQYDPDLVEADLSAIADLHFNLVNIQYGDLQGDWVHQGRTLMDFLERCRQHGLWARIALRATVGNEALTGALNSAVGSYLTAAGLPGNDCVFAYELLWEPFLGSHDLGGQGGFLNGVYTYNLGRLILDADWRTWVDEQYGSLARAEQIWGFSAPRDSKGLLTNPLDEQITTDGPWRTMVAAYRRFTEDYLGRNLGLLAREIRRTDGETPLTYRNWVTMTPEHNFNTGYDIGTAAAHLDFFSPEWYGAPSDRGTGLVVAYSRYRTGNKPVQWAEFGADIGLSGGSPAGRATQANICDRMMREVADDGANAASVWWWPGGSHPVDGTDFGIIDPDGTPRDCARVLAQWSATFDSSPPDLPPASRTTLNVDRDADARGSYAVFLDLRDRYVQERQSGQAVTLVDEGTGKNTATMPLVQAGNAPYAGAGPLQFANAEFAGIHVVCASLDLTVENGSQLKLPAGDTCQVSFTLVNSGEAQWLASAEPRGAVLLHTSVGDVPLGLSVPSLQRIVTGPVPVTMGQGTTTITGRMRVSGVGDFGEVLNLTLALDSTATTPCAISLSSIAPITAAAAGGTGVVHITTAAGCSWKTSSLQPWAVVAPQSGNGPADVNYTIQANPGPLRQASITIADRPLTVTQAGSESPPLLAAPAISPTSGNFGSQAIGVSSAPQTFTVTNGGIAAVNIATLAIGGANARDFRATNTCGSVLPVGAACRVSVTFTPTAVGVRSASFILGGNFTGPEPSALLTGAGTFTGPFPVVQAIVDSWNYTQGVAPGLWVTIVGTNLAGPPQSWNLDGVPQLPTMLGGVTVTFNGTPAPLAYVSATQINALAPATITPGPVQVVVQSNGMSSSPFTIPATLTQPAAYSLPDSAGSFFVTAALQGTSFLVGNNAVDPRVVRAAYPGDVLDLYMIGLGATADPSSFVTDHVFSGAFPVAAPVTASVAGLSAPVLFAGLTSPGLYLVRVSVPSGLPAGPQALQVSAGDVHTHALVLMVGTAPAPLARSAGLSSNTTREAVGPWPAGIPLQQGEVYRLAFRARADAVRALRFGLGPSGGAPNLSVDTTVTLGADWRQCVIYFRATATDPAAQLSFFFDDPRANFRLDSVVLQGTAR